MDSDTESLKERVQKYYDQHGWRSLETGSLVDVDIFIDHRDVSQVYQARERERDRRLLPEKGRYLLDAASGALPYTNYSEKWDYHVCLDFSIIGLQEARKRSGLGPRGLYVVADMCHIPFKSGSFEGILSAHTLYHIPEEGQVEACAELVRVLPSEGTMLIYYSNINSLSFRVKRLLERLTGRPVVLHRPYEVPKLFSNPLPRKRLEAIIRNGGGNPESRCHSFMSQYMLQSLIPNNRLGHLMLRLVYWFETNFGNLIMDLGHYFSIVVRKNEPS